MIKDFTIPFQHKTRVRQSNLELLRIIAMFLVLVVHANFFSLGAPTQEECTTVAIPSLLRFLIQAISIGCVDLFILISGYFGIRPGVRSFTKFIFQCSFFLWGIYLFMIFTGNAEISFHGILSALQLTTSDWFIKSYIVLYILAPVLNKYVESASEHNFRNILIVFFAYQGLYGWLSFAAQDFIFMEGYSAISFIGLYLLMRYIRLHIKKIPSKRKSLLLFIVCVFLLTASGYAVTVIGKPAANHKIFNYINPLVILSSVSLVILFSQIRIQNKTINHMQHRHLPHIYSITTGI